jgi:hypothetical protein
MSGHRRILAAIGNTSAPPTAFRIAQSYRSPVGVNSRNGGLRDHSSQELPLSQSKGGSPLTSRHSERRLRSSGLRGKLNSDYAPVVRRSILSAAFSRCPRGPKTLASKKPPERRLQAKLPNAAYFLILETIPPRLWGSQSWLQPAFSRPLPREGSLTSRKSRLKGVPRGDPRARLPAPQQMQNIADVKSMRH